MPLYEYQCKNCREVCEVLQKAKDKPLEKCPKCGGAMAKRISSPAIQFKGNGWYITDYAKKSSASAGPAAEAAGETKTEKKAEPKPKSGEVAGSPSGKSSS